MNSADLHTALMNVALEILELLKNKNRQYGDGNLLEYGVLGIILRIRDKLARLENHLFQSAEIDSDIVFETFQDIAGYAINALRLYKESRLTAFGALQEHLQGAKDDVSVDY